MRDSWTSYQVLNNVEVIFKCDCCEDEDGHSPHVIRAQRLIGGDTVDVALEGVVEFARKCAPSEKILKVLISPISKAGAAVIDQQLIGILN